MFGTSWREAVKDWLVIIGTYGPRSVQYVHCVMHKCIMVKVGGNEKHIKYVKKHVNLMKTEWEILKSMGERII